MVKDPFESLFKKKKGKNDIFGTNLGFGVPTKKQKNLWGAGLGLMQTSKKETERDTRRCFSPTQRKELLYQQNNKCARCHKPLDPRAIQYDHTKPWASGGRTITVMGGLYAVYAMIL